MPAFLLRLLRTLSVLDGMSFIYLLFHSIYSKRIMGDEEAIYVPGMIHGVVFCGLVASLLATSIRLKWPVRRSALVILCAFLPLAPLFLEFSLRREQKALKAAD